MSKNPPEPERPEDDVEMGFFEHVGELRKRLLRALVGIVPTVVLCWMYKEQLLDLVFQPLRFAYTSRGFPAKITFLNPVDPFVAFMEVSIIGGIVLASPWVFYQLWAFIAPGLYRRERLLAVPFVLASTLFFVGGVVFCYFLVFPPALSILLGYATRLPSGIQVEPGLTISEYMSFATRMLLAFGLVAEVPVVCTFLAAVRVVDYRQLASFFRWWLIVAAVLSAIITPTPDIGSQMLVLGPMVALYGVSIGIAYLIARARGETELDPNVER